MKENSEKVLAENVEILRDASPGASPELAEVGEKLFKSERLNKFLLSELSEVRARLSEFEISFRDQEKLLQNRDEAIEGYKKRIKDLDAALFDASLVAEKRFGIMQTQEKRIEEFQAALESTTLRVDELRELNAKQDEIVADYAAAFQATTKRVDEQRELIEKQDALVANLQDSYNNLQRNLEQQREKNAQLLKDGDILQAELDRVRNLVKGLEPLAAQASALVGRVAELERRPLNRIISAVRKTLSRRR